MLELSRSTRPSTRACSRAWPRSHDPDRQEAFGGDGGPALHITIEVVRRRGPYEPGDQPEYADKPGPNCHGLPRAARQPVVPRPGATLARRHTGRQRQPALTAAGRCPSLLARPDGGHRGHGRGQLAGQRAARAEHPAARPTRCPTSPRCCRPAAPRNDGEGRREDHLPPLDQAGHLRGGHDARHGAAGQHDHQRRYGGRPTYRAEFTDVAGLVEGDEVRIAGVRVGRWTDRRRATGPLAEVSSGRQDAPARRRHAGEDPLPQPRRPALHRADRGPGRGTTLRPDGIIPLAQTTPALDLTTLFGGFRPLFTAL